MAALIKTTTTESKTVPGTSEAPPVMIFGSYPNEEEARKDLAENGWVWDPLFGWHAPAPAHEITRGIGTFAEIMQVPGVIFNTGALPRYASA